MAHSTRKRRTTAGSSTEFVEIWRTRRFRSTGAIVGGVNINNIVRGTLQSGTLGYTAYASTTGHGYMAEGLGLLIQHAFGELGLHRLEANIQPDNTQSLALVKRLGFEREGYSTAFQFINGEWRDHERWAITAETAGEVAQPDG